MVKIVSFFIIIGALLWAGIVHSAEPVLRLGVVPQFDARNIKSIWQPILNEIERQTGLKIVLVGSTSIPEFEKQFTRGDFDIAYMNPYHLILAERAQGYRPVAKDISKKLSGIVVVRKDSGIEDLKQLNGKSIAFPAPNALGASLLPRAEFTQKYKIDYQPLYVKSHGSVYLNVAMGLQPAGGGVLRTFNKQPPKVKEKLRIIHTTPEVPAHPIVIHPRVAATVQLKFAEAIMSMGQQTNGQRMLAQIPIKQIGPADFREYGVLLAMGLERFTQ